jgi:hypothetical protein
VSVEVGEGRLATRGVGAGLVPTDVLAVDVAKAFLVVRNDFDVQATDLYHFNIGATSARICGRFAIGAPPPNKSLRRATITGALLAARSTAR